MIGSLRERCRAFTSSIRATDDALPFLKAVDTNVYETYEEKIAPSRPMDMGHIARRLRDREKWYETFEDMLVDFRVIFSNCLKFNDRPLEDAVIRGMADRCSARVEAFAKEVYNEPTAPGPRSKAAAAAASATADAPPPAPSPEKAAPDTDPETAPVRADSWVQCDRCRKWRKLLPGMSVRVHPPLSCMLCARVSRSPLHPPSLFYFCRRIHLTVRGCVLRRRGTPVSRPARRRRSSPPSRAVRRLAPSAQLRACGSARRAR